MFVVVVMVMMFMIAEASVNGLGQILEDSCFQRWSWAGIVYMAKATCQGQQNKRAEFLSNSKFVLLLVQMTPRNPTTLWKLVQRESFNYVEAHQTRLSLHQQIWIETDFRRHHHTNVSLSLSLSLSSQNAPDSIC